MNSAYLSTLPRGLTLQKASLFTSDSEQPPGSPHLQSRVGLTFYVNEPTTLQCRPSPWSARQRNGSWSPDNVPIMSIHTRFTKCYKCILWPKYSSCMAENQKILQSTVNLWHINSVLLFYCLVIVGWTKDAFTTGVCFAEKEWKQGIFHCNIKESVCDDPGTRLNIL